MSSRSQTSARPRIVAVLVTAIAVTIAACLSLFTSTATAVGSANTATSAAATTLTLKRSGSGIVVAGSKVAFKGTAASALRNRRIALQRKVGDGKRSKWVTLAKPWVGGQGSFSTSAKASGGGVNYWRVRGETKRGAVIFSNTVKTTVYQWYFVTDIATVDYEGAYEDDVTIGGKNFAQSLYGYYGSTGDSDWREYNLGYKCATFKATFGMDDSSETGSQADFFVTRDGARSGLGRKGLGAGTTTTLDVTGILRIRLEGVGVTNTDGDWAFGNPRVLCKKSPL